MQKLFILLSAALLCAGARADLVGYWTFDEGTGNSITNEVEIPGGGTHTTNIASGSALWGNGVLGGAVRLTGSTGSRFDVDLSAYNPAAPGANGFTVSAWLNIDVSQRYNSYTGIISSRKVDDSTGDNKQWGMCFKNDTKQFDFRIANTSGYTVSNLARNNQWMHVVMTWDGVENKKYTYIDGVLRHTSEETAVGTLLENLDIIRIGQDENDDSRHFRGWLDEVGIWTNALTETEVQTIYNNSKDGAGLGLDGVKAYSDNAPVTVSQLALADGLVHYWPCNDTSGSTMTDYMGDADYTLNGTGISWDPGMLNNCLSMGGNDYGTQRTLPGIEGKESVSMALWVKPADSTCDNWANILSKNPTADGVFVLLGIDTATSAPAGYIDWDFRIFGRSVTPSSDTTTDSKMIDQQWNLVAFTFDYTKGNSEDALTVWINGVNMNTDGVVNKGTYGTFSTPPADATYVLGQDRGSSDRRYGGDMDEIAIWDRALTDEEVLTLYDHGFGFETKSLYQEVTLVEGEQATLDSAVEAYSTGDVIAFPCTVSLTPADPNYTSNTPSFASTEEYQDLVITALDDSIRQYDRSLFLSTVTSDPNALAYPAGIFVTIEDNEKAEFVLTGMDDLVIGEVAIADYVTTDSFTIALTEAPDADVTINFTVDPAFVTIDPASITLTTTDYSAKTVTITAVDNSDANNATVPYESYTKVLSTELVTVDPYFADKSIADVNITIGEDDCGAAGFKAGDFNEDCMVDMLDLAELAMGWLDCNLPNNDNCIND